ncbi:cyanophycinase [Planctobacterium marinum]
MFVRITSAIVLLMLSTFVVAQSQLFLVGGSWKTCGSYGTSACKDDVSFPESAKTQNSYRISKDNIAQLKTLTAWQEQDKQLKGAVLNVLQNFLALHASKTFTKSEFQDKLADLSITLSGETITAKKLLSGLPDRLYYPIHDVLEAPSKAADGSFIREQASVIGTKYQSSQQIYQAFIEAVKKVTPKGQTPVVLVSTASGYDVFAAADYYLDIFASLGVDAQWLPIEATMAKLLDKGHCQNLATARADYVGVYNRETVYPYLAEYQQQFCQNPAQLAQLAQKANGIFFNGGDQSLTWQSFVNPQGEDRPWLAALRNKFNKGKLIISGTSAGTAVQSGKPGASEAGMITGGTSDGAMIVGAEAKAPWIERVDPHSSIRPVTYHAEGGLKFFPYGVLDTHFSERGRQLRLAKLVLSSNARFGFGVDETTALVTTPIDADNAKFEVVGQNGVYIVEQTQKSLNQPTTISYTSHYLVSGQRFELKDGKLVFPEADFVPFVAELDEIVSDKDLTQKTEYRDLLESQIAVAAKRSLAVFTNNDKLFTLSLQFNEHSAISKTQSMDNMRGYIHAQVDAKVAEL